METLKPGLIILLAVIVPYGFFYLVGAFVSLEFNPTEWAKEARLFYVLISSVVAAVLIIRIRNSSSNNR